MKQLWTWLALDRLDFMLLSGLVMFWWGLSGAVSPAVAWAACGGVVILFCLIGALRLKRGD